MQIETRLKRVESALKASTEKEYSTVVFVDKCPVFDNYILTIAGVEYQGTKEEIDVLLEPYEKGGSVIIYDDVSQR